MRKEKEMKRLNKKGNSHFEFVFKNNLLNSKRSQVTIFVILAIAIVVVLILLFVRRSDIIPISTTQTSPIYQIKTCMADAVKQEINGIAIQGGSRNPEPYYAYEGNKLQYLCYSNEYYQPCVMQKPMLKQDIEKEILDNTKSKIESCISVISDSLKKKGYNVNYNKPDIKVELVLNNILVTADNINMEISKTNKESYKVISTEVNSKMYQFVMIASSISNLEAHYGNSETMTYMMYYPSLRIQKIAQGDGTRVYILTDRESNEKFMFASKSMTYPAGITGN